MNKLTKSEDHWKSEAERYYRLYSWQFQTDSIKAMAARKDDNRLYRKVGKKFLPVNDPYAYDGLKNGFWLIGIKDGCTSIRQQIYPDKSHITAAARLMEDKLVEIMVGINVLKNESAEIQIQEIDQFITADKYRAMIAAIPK